MADNLSSGEEGVIKEAFGDVWGLRIPYVFRTRAVRSYFEFPNHLIGGQHHLWVNLGWLVSEILISSGTNDLIYVHQLRIHICFSRCT